MYLIDTSIWIDVFRDRTQARAAQLRAHIGGRAMVLCRLTQLELLQGAKGQQEWEWLDRSLSEQRYLEMALASWREAAWLESCKLCRYQVGDLHISFGKYPWRPMMETTDGE